jgi:hypothetical protein
MQNACRCISTIAVVKTNDDFILMMTTSVSLFDNHRHGGAAYYSPPNLLLPVKKLAGDVSRCPTLHELVFRPDGAGDGLGILRRLRK